MKKLNFYLLCCLFFCTIAISAKQITFRLPSKALKSYVFYTYNGLNTDTLFSGKTDFAGNGFIEINANLDSIPFMGTLSFDDQQALDLIVAEGNFSVEEKDNKLVFSNSQENDLFYNNQKDVMKQEYKNSFVQKYLKQMAAVMELNQIAYNEGKRTMQSSTQARVNALKYVDPDILYYTKFWNFGINGFMLLSSSQSVFATDMIKLLAETQLDNVYVAFVEDLILITNQYGLDDAFEQIMQSVIDGKRIKYPQGSIFEAYEAMKVKKGTKLEYLPIFKTLTYTPEKTLLIFNRSDCEHCIAEMEKLKELYPDFVDQKIRVVSITSAPSEEEYLKNANIYPWIDKEMDSSNYKESYFNQYGILGTPTFILLDSNNVVLGKHSTLDGVLRNLD